MKRTDTKRGFCPPISTLFKTHRGLILVLILCACEGGEHTEGEDPTERSIKRASRFELQEKPYGHLLRTLDQDGGLRERYRLIERGKELPDTLKGGVRIRVPVKRIACLSAPHAGMLLELNAEDRIAAFPSKGYLYSKKLRGRMESGDIESIGTRRSVDTERLIDLKVDLLLGNGMNSGPGGTEQFLKRAGIPSLGILAWKEEHPLGRLAWIRVFGVLTGHRTLADSILEKRSLHYDSLKKEVGSVSDGPKVLCNAPHKGTWHIPGGESYMARLIRDAGGDHPWPDDQHTGGVPKSLEEVIARGKDADVWLNPGSAKDLRDVASVDDRITEFKAFSKRKVYNNDARVTEAGGNDFWESGPLHPELLLSDLIHIFHPDMNPEWELHYYRRLPKGADK